MKVKTFGFTAAIGIFLWTFASGVVVNADDEEHEERDEEEVHERLKYDKNRYDEEEDFYDDDDEHDYDEYEYESPPANSTSNINTWHIWTRTAFVNKGELPFYEARQVEMTLANGQNARSLYMIPLDGELFVPGQTVAEMLGAKATFYETSKILEITNKKTELLFRAGTNVVYDNKVKTPMPATVFYMSNQVYVPINVITNGLGYVAEWNAGNNTVLCKPLTMER